MVGVIVRITVLILGTLALALVIATGTANAGVKQNDAITPR